MPPTEHQHRGADCGTAQFDIGDTLTDLGADPGRRLFLQVAFTLDDFDHLGETIPHVAVRRALIRAEIGIPPGAGATPHVEGQHLTAT